MLANLQRRLNKGALVAGAFGASSVDVARRSIARHVESVSPRPGRVVDAFIFFNELDLLEMRLEELFDVVDVFVLVEATRTFRGEPKPLHFAENRSRFQPYASKIRHVVVTDLPDGDDPWVREYFESELGKRSLTSLMPERAYQDLTYEWKPGQATEAAAS